jgi:hypothetical protein
MGYAAFKCSLPDIVSAANPSYGLRLFQIRRRQQARAIAVVALPDEPAQESPEQSPGFLVLHG